VSASLYKRTDIAKYQAANNPAQPLDSLRSAALNRELVKIAEMIEEAARHPAIPVQDTAAERTPQGTRANTSPPEQPFEPEMILIPAGEFFMGSDPRKDENAQDDEQPQHMLYLPDYYLAKTPVTNAQYAAFVQAVGWRAIGSKWTGDWAEGKSPPGKADHPVNEVTWDEAMAYCRWLSEVTGRAYSLPSEAEWEKGARGPMDASTPGAISGMPHGAMPIKATRVIPRRWTLTPEAPAPTACWTWLGTCGSGRGVCGATIPTWSGHDAKIYNHPMIRPVCCGEARSTATPDSRGVPIAAGSAHTPVAGTPGFG
jgi:hypothetical protein